MSFYLVNQQLNTTISIPNLIVVFSKVMQLQGRRRILIVISSKGIVSIYQLSKGYLIQQWRLVQNSLPIQTLLKVQICCDLAILISFKNFYLLNLDQLITTVKKSEEFLEKEIKSLKICKNAHDVTFVYTSKLNKIAKILKKHQKFYLKMAGRNYEQLTYIYGILNEQKAELLLQTQWQSQFNYEYKASLESLANNCIIYQSYCNKGRPIKLHIAQCISQSDSQFLVTGLDVIHFYQQITVIDMALLNDQILCMFGNDNQEEVRSSLMILYNIKQKCTLNYLRLNEVAISQIFWFHHEQYQFSYNNCLSQFDCVQIEKERSKSYQLYPQSYQTDNYCNLKGKVLSIDKNFILTENKGEIIVYPKVHKTAIYYKWMTFLGVHEIQCLSMISELLQ